MSLNRFPLLLGSIAAVLASASLASSPAAAQSSVLGDPNANPTGDVRPNEVVQGSGVSAQDLIRNIMLAPTQSMNDFDSQQPGRIDNAANDFLRRSQQQQQSGNGGNGAASDRPNSPSRN
ncbi:MAG TPA: hypothetical protein V6D46_02515 [Coleofasciculaceae cyanobacterium]